MIKLKGNVLLAGRVLYSTRMSTALELEPPPKKRMCIHLEDWSSCLACRDKRLCEHGSFKYRCIDCGTGRCQHHNWKHQCKECGKGYCMHGRMKHQCKQCGTGRCEHGTWKHACDTCISKLQKSKCGRCKKCIHDIRFVECRVCDTVPRDYICNDYCKNCKLRFQFEEYQRRSGQTQSLLTASLMADNITQTSVELALHGLMILATPSAEASTAIPVSTPDNHSEGLLTADNHFDEPPRRARRIPRRIRRQ